MGISNLVEILEENKQTLLRHSRPEVNFDDMTAEEVEEYIEMKNQMDEDNYRDEG